MSPSMPSPPPPPPPPAPPPEVNEARETMRRRDEMARRRGRAATVLSEPSQSMVQPDTAAKKLLGG